MMKLSDVNTNETVMISHIEGSGAFRARLSEMGFVTGKTVKKLFTSPVGNPIVFELMGGQIALRKSEAEKIQVTVSGTADAPSTTPEADIPAPSTDIPTDIPTQKHRSDRHQRRSGTVMPPSPHTGCPSCGPSGRRITTDTPAEAGVITIALVGNPNCGKTSLFNAASGGHERTGNYSGVTVSSVVGEMVFDGRKIRLVDLPGTYSIRAFSPEEAYVAHELESGRIDAVINVLDTTNLERNLLLTMQLKERNLPLVGALNMYDEFEESQSTLDIEELSRRLDMPLYPTVARKRIGIDTLLKKAIELADQHIALHRAGIQGHTHEAACCNDPEHCTHCSGKGAHPEDMDADNGSDTACPCPEREHEDVERYSHIGQILDGIYIKKHGRSHQVTTTLDRLLANRWIAYPLFVAIMWFIFWVTFTIGQYPMDWIDNGVAWLTALCESQMPEGTLQALVCDGILGGVGSVIVFLPNILILYFFISILEDSGYLARAAMLADPLFNKLGLHGKSFIPMLMGYGCNVPAVMATRTIENPKSRMITMLVTPMISCSARIPVYVVFAGAFFPQNASTVMLCLYVFGTGMALFVAWVFSKIFMRRYESHFVMELPPYRLPSSRGVCRHTWEKGRQYLRKMGGIILVASIVIWALGHFTTGNGELTEAEQQEQSYMGRIGHAIEPIIRPLGYDWRMGVGIIAGVGAKELMVSTLGVLYNCAAEDAEPETTEDASQTRLAQILSQHTTPEAALSYMIFALLYFPCLATIAAVKGESGTWKWAIFTAAYTTLLAYVTAFAVYRMALLF